MYRRGTWGHGLVADLQLRVGLYDLEGLFQPKQFCFYFSFYTHDYSSPKDKLEQSEELSQPKELIFL